MTFAVNIQVEELFHGDSAAPSYGKEQKVCDCGGKLDEVRLHAADGVVEKVCCHCQAQHYIDVSF